MYRAFTSVASLLDYSLRPKIFVGEINVSRCILVIDTSIFMHFFDKCFWTEGVPVSYHFCF